MAAPEDNSHFSPHVCGTAERLGIPATQAQAQIMPAEPPHVPQDENLRELILFIVGQLHTLERSLFAELERSQVETLAMLFTPTRVEGKAYWCREGEDAHTLAIIIAGALVVQNDSDIDPVAYLLPGDTTGETELCGHRSRGSAVRALMPTLVAEIDFEELTQFIEVCATMRFAPACSGKSAAHFEQTPAQCCSQMQ
jgi:CRP-like cAMP-binding protein